MSNLDEYNFEKSVNIYTATYHHFLDGLINTTEGNSLDNVFKTLNDLIKINTEFKNKCCFLIPELKFPNYELNFYKIDQEGKKNLVFKNKISYSNFFLLKSYRENSYNEQILSNFRDILSFCIFPTGFNNHLTSSVIFIKENEYSQQYKHQT